MRDRASPYIDLVPVDIISFQVPFSNILGLLGELSKSLQQVILVPLMYLGWGRGGLLGEGSSVVEFGENRVPWSNPRGLDVRWKRVLFCFARGWDVLLPGVEGLAFWGL